MESLPRVEPGPPSVEPGQADDAPASDGPPHLSDPRALQILATEHWGQLTQRSLVYNETFTRGSMFLTFLSASLVALGFVYQGAGPDFVWILIAVLVLDLIVGLATLGRLNSAGLEEFRAIQAMNRIRHAYLEMVPSLEAYLSNSRYDDADSILEMYGAEVAQPGRMSDVLHGLTTMPGLVAILNTALIGTIVGAVIAAMGGDVRLCLIGGLFGVLLSFVLIVVVSFRVYGTVERQLVVRFPKPKAATPSQPPGRLNT